VLFFIELATRRVHLGGCSANPNGSWMIQQARNLAVGLESRLASMGFIVHDRDSKFTAAFDEVFSAQGVEVIRTPYRAPKANAVAERWVRTVRQECLDWLLIMSRRHLERVLRIYIEHYNLYRPHRSLGLEVPTDPGPDPFPPVVASPARPALRGGYLLMTALSRDLRYRGDELKTLLVRSYLALFIAAATIFAPGWPGDSEPPQEADLWMRMLAPTVNEGAVPKVKQQPSRRYEERSHLSVPFTGLTTSNLVSVALLILWPIASIRTRVIRRLRHGTALSRAPPFPQLA
jgi:putative transposase